MLKKKKIVKVIGIIVVLGITISSGVIFYNYKNYENKLNHAKTMLVDGEYDNAIDEFNNLKASKFSKRNNKEIKDSIILANELKVSEKIFEDGLALFNNKKYMEAIDKLKEIKAIDTKRYTKAQEKIKEASTKYIKENIELAKAEAEKASYDKAIKYLDSILEFDKSNNDATTLKTKYVNEIEKIKKEEETKRLAEEEAKRLAEEEARKLAQEEAKKQEEIVNNSNQNTNSNININDGESTEKGYTVSASRGWFAIKRPGVLSPEGFGIRIFIYSNGINCINYDFVGCAAYATYTMVVELPNRTVTETGETTGVIKSIYVEPGEVIEGDTIKVTVNAVYNGETYTSTFTEVL